MQVELIEDMIANKLELSGMKNEGAEGQCRALLYHLYTALELYRLMVPAEKQIAKEWHDVFAKDFRVNQFLKELKRTKNKEKKVPCTPKKRKTKKKKCRKPHTLTRARSRIWKKENRHFGTSCSSMRESTNVRCC